MTEQQPQAQSDLVAEECQCPWCGERRADKLHHFLDRTGSGYTHCLNCGYPYSCDIWAEKAGKATAYVAMTVGQFKAVRRPT